MKPKNMVTVKSEPELGYAKQNLKMAISRPVGQKEMSRGTVLVNNMNQRTVIQNRVVTQGRNINLSNNELLRCKRKINFLPTQTYPGTQPPSVARRNARERNRVKQVNNGFATLRSHIPPSVAAALSTEKPAPRNSAASKKLSKVETLKMAVEYIRSLQDMLEDHNGSLEKKDTSDAYERFEIEESYYSSSPDSSSQTVVMNPAETHYSSSPDRVFPKAEPMDPEYYPHRRIYPKSEPEMFVKSEMYRPKLDNFNQEIHDTLTSEFYHARSPVKQFYASPERSPTENYKNFEEKNYEQLGEIAIIPEDSPSPGKMSEFRYESPKNSLTVLSSVPSSQVLQYTGHSFAHPRLQHRSSTSLSPTMSDACPSPTPSFSSDHASIVSGSSGHLTSRLSRLSTQLSSPPPPQTLSPTRNPSPNTPAYPNGVEFHKGSPEGYENYEPMSPEDEELLDAISWWQQSH